MTHKELTEKIIGCAYRVHNRTGTGFLESAYEKRLVLDPAQRDGKSRESERSRTFRRDKQDSKNLVHLVIPSKKDTSP